MAVALINLPPYLVHGVGSSATTAGHAYSVAPVHCSVRVCALCLARAPRQTQTNTAAAHGMGSMMCARTARSTPAVVSRLTIRCHLGYQEMLE